MDFYVTASVFKYVGNTFMIIKSYSFVLCYDVLFSKYYSCFLYSRWHGAKKCVAWLLFSRDALSSWASVMGEQLAQVVNASGPPRWVEVWMSLTVSGRLLKGASICSEPWRACVLRFRALESRGGAVGGREVLGSHRHTRRRALEQVCALERDPQGASDAVMGECSELQSCCSL